MKKDTCTLLHAVLAHLCWRTAAKSLSSYWSCGLHFHYPAQRDFSYGSHTMTLESQTGLWKKKKNPSQKKNKKTPPNQTHKKPALPWTFCMLREQLSCHRRIALDYNSEAQFLVAHSKEETFDIFERCRVLIEFAEDFGTDGKQISFSSLRLEQNGQTVVPKNSRTKLRDKEHLPNTLNPSVKVTWKAKFVSLAQKQAAVHPAEVQRNHHTLSWSPWPCTQQTCYKKEAHLKARVHLCVLCYIHPCGPEKLSWFLDRRWSHPLGFISGPQEFPECYDPVGRPVAHCFLQIKSRTWWADFCPEFCG